MLNYKDKLELIYQRDLLFDKYLKVYDNYQSWISGRAQVVGENKKNPKRNRTLMIEIVGKELDSISAQLREMDNKLTRKLKIVDIYTQNKELN